MRKRSWIACAVACALGLGVQATAQAQNRYFFQGPFGAGGTYNLYELKGAGDISVTPGQHFGRYSVLNASPLTLNTGAADTWWNAHNAAATTTETVSGTNKVAHLAAFSGATAKGENDFVHQQAFFGDVWIGLSDDENIGVAGAGETMSTVADPAVDGLKGLNGVGTGWRWTNGETFDFANWGGGEPNNAGVGEDAAHLRGDSLWNDNADGLDGEGTAAFKYVYEYETRSAAPLTINNSINLAATPDKTPGGQGGLGFMSVREVHSTSTVSGNTGAINTLFSGGDVEVSYQAATLNLNNISTGGSAGGGQYGGDTEFGLITQGGLSGDINNFAVRAHGYIRIPAGEGGKYTFNVNTDDSGELWIYGKTFESVTGGSITPYGSIGALGDRGAADTLGVVTLEPGDYEFEYVMNENGGGASAELSVAPGVHTAFNVAKFDLLGSQRPAFVHPGGTTLRTGGDFQVKEVIALPEGSNLIDTLAKAKALLAAPDGDDLTFTGTSATVNASDPFNFPDHNSGRFTGDSNFLNDANLGFDDNDFVYNAKTTIVVDTAGDYTFAFDSDDGAELTITGATFTSSFGPAVANGASLTADILTGSSLSGGWVNLQPGTYNLEYTMFERGGGAFAELMVAPGRQPAYASEVFSLLSGTTSTVTGFTRPAALTLGDGTFDPNPGQEGDTDGDGDVDLTDLNNVRNNFGGTTGGDTNGDGLVDLTDLNNVRNNFGATAGANAVPEPSSLVLVGLGLAGLFAARRMKK